MSSLKTKLIPLVLMLAFLFLWYNTSKIAVELSTENVSLRYAKAADNTPYGLSQKNLDELPSNNTLQPPSDTPLPQIMLWNQTDNVIASSELDFYATTCVIDVYGVNLLNMKMVDGSPLSRNDKSGCTIDKKTAYSLFGTVDAVGKTLYIDDKSYVIRGVFEEKQPVIMRNSYDDEMSFSNAELLFENTSNGREDASNLISTYNLPNPSVIIDGSLITMLLKLIIALPTIILSLVLAIRMLFRAFKVSNQLLLFLIAISGMILVTIGLVLILEIPLSIPIRFIPSKWSDLSFWGNQLKTIGEQLKDAFAFSKTVIESRTIEDAISLLTSFISMLFAFILLVERIRVRSFSPLILSSLVAVAAVFIFCVAVVPSVGSIDNLRSIFLTLPCYFAVDFLIHRWDKWLTLIPQKEGADDFKTSKEKYKQRFLSYEDKLENELVK